MKPTASKHAKSKGLKGGLKTMADLTGVSRGTLNNWFMYKPELFDVVIDGCLSRQDINEAMEESYRDTYRGGDNGSRMQSELVEYIKGLSSAVSERDELNAQCDRLRDVVFDELDSDRAMDLLLEEPKQSLAEVQAKAIDRFRATITENLPISCQLEFIYESKNYTNQLREQAKEGVK
jgi:AcrR family transcriptional regulator